jgi:hypothetical protein
MEIGSLDSTDQWTLVTVMVFLIPLQSSDMFQLKSYTDISGIESKYMMHGSSKDEAEA